MNQPSLFPESTEQRVKRLDGEILHLLTGGIGGPLALSLSDDEKKVLHQIRFHRGHANAVSIREIEQATGLIPRFIKLIVRSLRVQFRLPIMSSKHASQGGYFLMITPEDRAIWIKDVTDQIRAEAAVVRAAAGPRAALDMFGQLYFEAQQAEEANHA